MAPFVAMPSSGGDGTAIAQTSGAALTGNVSVNALRADGPITGIGLTVTINSGGPILHRIGFQPHRPYRQLPVWRHRHGGGRHLRQQFLCQPTHRSDPGS